MHNIKVEMRPLPKGILHIYAQGQWHEEAYIIADIPSLNALKEAISLAIKEGQSEVELWASDGEGFGLRIIRHSDKWDDWKLISMPYVDHMAEEHRDDAIAPYQLWKLNEVKDEKNSKL